jgi:uncharacterized protein
MEGQDMTEFTPWAGLLGGVLIGLAAIILMAGPGRVLGASGIFAGLLTLDLNAEFKWRLIFVLGMLIGTAWTGLLAFDASSLTFSAGPLATIVGGVLVGAGTVMGSGCTSGHGICGLARFSIRSLAATATFMVVAILTVFISRHLVGV